MDAIGGVTYPLMTSVIAALLGAPAYDGGALPCIALGAVAILLISVSQFALVKWACSLARQPGSKLVNTRSAWA